MQYMICWTTLILWLATLGATPHLIAVQQFSIATYNLENYLENSAGTRSAKSEAARRKIRECFRAIKADVVALQEVGSLGALQELRQSLKAEGLDYPQFEYVEAFDTNIHVAVLSRFPIVARRSHTNDSYLLQGRRYRVLRGFAEVDIRVNPNYTFTLMTTHLKSRRTTAEADEADIREQEALILREKIDARSKENPDLNLVVLGDFNDTRDARSTRAVIGRGRFALVDTRPAERNGDDQPNPNPRYDPRNITWTHFYGVEDSYSRIDYILLSKAMVKEWIKSETYVLALPNWGVGSDHRPVVAEFAAEEKK